MVLAGEGKDGVAQFFGRLRAVDVKFAVVVAQQFG